jgi:hypothetical protein
MPDEIRRRKTSDPEMDAILVIAQALEPLSRTQAQRVLDWAEKRFTRVELPGLSADMMASTNRFMEALGKTASRMGMATPEDLLQAMARVASELPAESEQVPS